MAQSIFRLPDIGEGVVEGEIVAWHIKPGDTVSEDQPLVDVMTDKATVTIPSAVDAQVVSTRGQVGEMIAVGSELIVFELNGNSPAELAVHEPAKSSTGVVMQDGADSSGDAAVAVATEPAASPRKSAGASSPADRPLASPAVRRRAREKGVDLQQVSGTGPGGRILDSDVENFLSTGTATSGTRRKRTGKKEIPISGLRRRIAEKMTVSSQNIPHFSYIEQVDITELAQLRTYLNDQKQEHQPKLTFLPFFMLAVARAFENHPESNAHYDEKRGVVTQYESVHLGIATHTDRGLYVPVVRHVEAMDLWEAAESLKRVTQGARDNTAKREDLSGSTFTITSLGAMGGLAATPIINHPEVGILAIHKAYDRPVVLNGQIAVRHMVNVSASFDHRIVDGADGAALVQNVKDLLEHPAAIFI